MEVSSVVTTVVVANGSASHQSKDTDSQRVATTVSGTLEKRFKFWRKGFEKNISKWEETGKEIASNWKNSSSRSSIAKEPAETSKSSAAKTSIASSTEHSKSSNRVQDSGTTNSGPNTSAANDISSDRSSVAQVSAICTPDAGIVVKQELEDGTETSVLEKMISEFNTGGSTEMLFKTPGSIWSDEDELIQFLENLFHTITAKYDNTAALQNCKLIRAMFETYAKSKVHVATSVNSMRAKQREIVQNILSSRSNAFTTKFGYEWLSRSRAELETGLCQMDLLELTMVRALGAEWEEYYTTVRKEKVDSLYKLVSTLEKFKKKLHSQLNQDVCMEETELHAYDARTSATVGLLEVCELPGFHSFEKQIQDVVQQIRKKVEEKNKRRLRGETCIAKRAAQCAVAKYCEMMESLLEPVKQSTDFAKLQDQLYVGILSSFYGVKRFLYTDPWTQERDGFLEMIREQQTEFLARNETNVEMEKLEIKRWIQIHGANVAKIFIEYGAGVGKKRKSWDEILFKANKSVEKARIALALKFPRSPPNDLTQELVVHLKNRISAFQNWTMPSDGLPFSICCNEPIRPPTRPAQVTELPALVQQSAVISVQPPGGAPPEDSSVQPPGSVTHEDSSVQPPGGVTHEDSSVQPPGGVTHEDSSVQPPGVTHQDSSVQPPAVTHEDASVQPPVVTHEDALVQPPVVTHEDASVQPPGLTHEDTSVQPPGVTHEDSPVQPPGSATLVESSALVPADVEAPSGTHITTSDFPSVDRNAGLIGGTAGQSQFRGDKLSIFFTCHQVHVAFKVGAELKRFALSPILRVSTAQDPPALVPESEPDRKSYVSLNICDYATRPELKETDRVFRYNGSELRGFCAHEVIAIYLLQVFAKFGPKFRRQMNCGKAIVGFSFAFSSSLIKRIQIALKLANVERFTFVHVTTGIGANYIRFNPSQTTKRYHIAIYLQHSYLDVALQIVENQTVTTVSIKTAPLAAANKFREYIFARVCQTIDGVLMAGKITADDVPHWTCVLDYATPWPKPKSGPLNFNRWLAQHFKRLLPLHVQLKIRNIAVGMMRGLLNIPITSGKFRHNSLVMQTGGVRVLHAGRKEGKGLAEADPTFVDEVSARKRINAILGATLVESFDASPSPAKRQKID